MNLAPSGDGHTFDEERIPVPEACRRLEEAGADVVGINCFAGPDTMIPMMKEIKKVVKVSTYIQKWRFINSDFHVHIVLKILLRYP